MLSIPHMRPDGAADTTHLAIFLRSQNSYNENDILNDVARFSQIRRDAVVVQEASDMGQQTLLRYVAHLRALIPRLAINEIPLKTLFSWHDGFSAAKKESHANMYFDLAACLWNLGAFESVRGSRVDRSTDEGVRAASRHFQQAAGYFDYLREHVQINLTPTPSQLPCLSSDCLNMVKQLLLAQAQLCFYEKAVRDKKKDSMKSSIIAKLALQTSLFYSAASIAGRGGSLPTILDMSWFAISDFQAKCFLGAAEYWQALASKEAALQKGNGYGEEVARYNRAEQHLRNAIDFGRKCSVSSSLTTVADSLLSVILSNRTTAVHDLSTVYMEAIPNDSSLVDVAPVAMVKPSSLPDVSALVTDQEALFRYVLPRPVIDANRHFYEEINAMYSQATTLDMNATNLGKSTLSSVGLPGSLEVVKPESPLPDSIWNKIQKTQTMGGLDRLRVLLEDVKAIARRTVTTMSCIDETLDREIRQDEAFHTRYPPYRGALSSSLNQDIKLNLQKLREAYANAQKNDETLTSTLFSPTTINQLAKLALSREQIQALFPNSTAEALGSVNLLDIDDAIVNKPGKLSPIAAQLEEKLHFLAGIFETRQQHVQTLQSLTQVDLLPTIQQILTSDTTTSAPASAPTSIAAVHTSYLAQAKDLVSAVQQLIAQQETMLQQIIHLNEQFIQSKINDPVAKARNVVIQSLEEAVNLFLQIHSQISSGQTFYSNLQVCFYAFLLKYMSICDNFLLFVFINLLFSVEVDNVATKRGRFSVHAAVSTAGIRTKSDGYRGEAITGMFAKQQYFYLSYLHVVTVICLFFVHRIKSTENWP